MWQDYRFESVEDQQKFIVPINRETEKIYYNLRMIVDNRGIETEPRAWRVSKVNRLTSNGLVNVTLAQDRFDQFKDWIEREDPEDPTSKIIGMWANGRAYIPQKPPADHEIVIPSADRSEITYSGKKPVIKVGGSYKKFSVVFYEQNEVVGYQDSTWAFTIKLPSGETVDATDLVSVLETETDGTIKVKYVGDDTYLGNILVITNTATTGTITSTCEVEITGL